LAKNFHLYKMTTSYYVCQGSCHSSVDWHTVAQHSILQSPIINHCGRCNAYAQNCFDVPKSYFTSGHIWSFKWWSVRL